MIRARQLKITITAAEQVKSSQRNTLGSLSMKFDMTNGKMKTPVDAETDMTEAILDVTVKWEFK